MNLSTFIYNLSLNFLIKFVNLVGGFLLLPWFLKYWGDQVYGEWLMIYALVGYLTSMDFGLSAYVINRLTQDATKNQWQDYIQVLHTALFVSLIICLGILMSLGLLSVCLPLDQWFLMLIHSHQDAIILGLLLSLQIILSIYQRLLRGLYRTVGNFFYTQLLFLIQRLLFFGVTAVVVWASVEPILLALVQLLPFLLTIGYILGNLHKHYPHIHFGLQQRDSVLAWSFLFPSLSFFLLQLANGFSMQGMTLLVGVALGAKSVVIFNALRLLSNLLLQVVNSFNAVLWPAFTVIEVQGNYQKLQQIQFLALKGLLFLTLCLGIWLHFIAEDVVRIWTHGFVYYNANLMDALLIYTLYLTLFNTMTVGLLATNQHQQLSIYTLFSTLCGLVLAYHLATIWGMAGMVYGVLFADIVCRAWLVKSAFQLIRQPLLPLIEQIGLKGSVIGGMTYGLFYAWFALLFTETNWLAWLLALPLIMLLVGITSYYFWLTPGEQHYSQNLGLRLRQGWRKKV